MYRENCEELKNKCRAIANYIEEYGSIYKPSRGVFPEIKGKQFGIWSVTLEEEGGGFFRRITISTDEATVFDASWDGNKEGMNIYTENDTECIGAIGLYICDSVKNKITKLKRLCSPFVESCD